MPRKHDRTAFYKLANTDTAKKMIEHRTLRWRAPLQFNDPFDTQTSLSATIDEAVFVERFLDRLVALSYDDELPRYFDPENRLHQAAMLTRNNQNRGPREAFAKFMRPSAIESARGVLDGLAKLSDSVTSHLQNGRIFCMTEDVNNVVMWSHYADEHRGVGFKLRVLDEIDHLFLMSRKVDYSEKYLCVGNSIELADHFSRAAPINISALCWDLVYLKHEDWRYEKEWRCYIPLLDKPAGTGFDDIAQDPRLFEAIYLGCKMVEPTTTEIIGLARKHLPDTEIYQARKSRTSFDLEFDRIA